MARWVRVLALGGEVGTMTLLANAGSFLLPVTCVLALVVVVTASCAVHSHFRRSRDNNSSTHSATSTESSTHSATPTESIKPAPMSPDRALNNSSKKLSISEEQEQSGQENEAYDRGVKGEQGGGDSLWQRRILMGERCQPPNFSGQIVYDHKGNRLSQFPLRPPKHYLFHPSSKTDDPQRP